MTRPKKLPWGKSPFDDMERDELLLWARRMYAACASARSAMALTRGPEPWSGFWTKGGSGADAMAMADLIVEEVERRFDHESIYRSFYRYAVDLLFTPALGFGWEICMVEGCDIMMGASIGKRARPKCIRHPNATMRPISWDDLRAKVRR